MAQVIKTTFQFKRANASRWIELNPILADGEPGFELDTGKLKIGRNSLPWKLLEYTFGSYSLSPDGNSLVIEDDNVLQIYGFSSALENQIPFKGADGKIHWKSISLRRDNHFNYKDDFIPDNGEVCFVDTAREGLRVIVGDGATAFKNLNYIDEYYVKGYYFENVFYKDSAHTEPLLELPNKIYIDVSTNIIYYYNNVGYVAIAGGTISSLPTATAQQAGVMKLYNETGYNSDGTMTQAAITKELNEKVEVEFDHEKELLIFFTD